jgi:hypothetical protein
MKNVVIIATYSFYALEREFLNPQFVMCFLFVFEIGPPSVAQADLILALILPQPPECWNYRHAHYTVLTICEKTHK